MDAGLKKLWGRRKSKGRDATQDSGVSSLRESQRTDQSGQSIPTSPRAVKASTPVGVDSRKRMQPTQDEASRPSTSVSRPSTSGSDSLMSAVNRAADAIVRTEQEYHDSAEHYSKGRVRNKNPRYVDIFSLSKSNGIASPAIYNEDVAERNLDLTRVALEGSHIGYDPASKYQEDVAARNAYPTSPLGNNAKESPYVDQGGFDGGHSSGRQGQTSSRTGNYPQIPQRHDDRPLSKDQNMHSSNGAHFGHLGGGLTDLAARQHGLDRDAALNGHLVPMPFASHDGPDTIDYGLPSSHPGHGGKPQNQETRPTQALRSYQLSSTEMSQARLIERPQPSQPKTSRYTGGTNSSQGTDYNLRSASSLSNASSVKRAIKLPNRTILDLTGDDSDVFSETTLESNYSSSPVVEHAKIDKLRKIPVSAVTGPALEDDTTVSGSPPPTATSTFSGEVRSNAPEVVQSQPPPEGASEALGSENRARYPRSTSAFSAVNTIATSSPRASVVLESISTVSNGRATQGYAHPTGNTPEPHHTVEGKTPARYPPEQGESIEDVELVQQPAKAARVQPDQGSALAPETIANGESVMPENQQGAVPDQDGSQEVQMRPSRAQNSISPPQLQPYSHLGPNSVHPSDSGGTNHPPGVIARDFASMATKSMLSSVPEDTESDGGRVRRPGQLGDHRRFHSHDPSRDRPYRAVRLPLRPPIFESTINEEELARKQAEARAALVRLQESLNENFLDPAPAPVIRTSSRAGASRPALSSIDGNSVAPSSISTQVKTASPTPPEIRVEADQTVDDVEPETSYHGLTTLPRSEPPVSGKSGGLGQYEEEHQTLKGKQRAGAGAGAEDDLEGPGPPILTDGNESGSESKQPSSLPVPPTLRVNGQNESFYYTHQQQPPPSPGEISLSSFPIPVSSSRQSTRPPSTATGPSQQAGDQQEPQQQPQQMVNTFSHSRPGSGSVGTRRRSSQRSQASTASAFSIPVHLIPGRSSSIRDRSVAEE